jgi:hypothetical protein
VSNGERADFHMNDFYSYFMLHPVADEAEDVVMKLFSHTLHGNAKKWYNSLPNAASPLWTSWRKFFLKNGAFGQKTSQYYKKILRI